MSIKHTYNEPRHCRNTNYWVDDNLWNNWQPAEVPTK
jgi:hypothetical protein